MAEEATAVVEQPKPTAKPPIQMGRSLSSQSAALTKLLQTEPKEKPDEIKPDEKKEEKPVDDVKPTAPVLPDEDETPEVKPVELGPINKYILDRLPRLQTRIKDGEGTKVVSFKDVSELPAGFELADDATRAQFTVDVTAQVGRAKDAVNEYKNAELNENVRKFEEQESKDVASDVAYLQKAGILEKFKYDEDDPNFNSDEAVKTANAIYDLYKKTNEAYMRKYAGSNRTFRISYRDAADKYFAAQGRATATAAADESQKAKEQPKEVKKEKTPAQKEREEVAKQTGAPAGGEPSSNKPKVRPGMRMDDINRLVRMGKI